MNDFNNIYTSTMTTDYSTNFILYIPRDRSLQGKGVVRNAMLILL